MSECSVQHPKQVEGMKEHTKRAVNSAATGSSSVWYCSTIVSMQLLRMSKSVSSDNFKRATMMLVLIRPAVPLVPRTLNDLANLRGDSFLDYTIVRRQ